MTRVNRKSPLKRPRPLAAALVKKVAEYRYYRLDYFVGLLIKFVFLLAMITGVGPGSPEELNMRIIGFILWYFSAHILAKMGNILIEEAYLGTLPQVLVTRTSLMRFATATALAEVLLSTIWIAAFVLIVWPMLPSGISAMWASARWVMCTLCVSALCLVGIAGMGFVLFGLSVEWKRVGAFTEVLIFFMLFFSGFFIPPHRLPAAILVAGRASPLFWSVKALGIPLGQETASGTVIPLMVVALVWVAAGMLSSRYFIERAKLKGTLTHY